MGVPSRPARVLALLAALGFLAAHTAKADSNETLSVTASFASSDVNPTPDLYLTGAFTFDTTTDTVTAFNMGLLGPLGAVYEFSSGTGGASSYLCESFAPCGLGGSIVTFSDSTAQVSLDLVGSSLTQSVGQIFEMCPQDATYYGTTRYQSIPCLENSGAAFDGVSGSVYNLPNTTGQEDFGIPSGSATVIATPEPPALPMLLVGVLGLWGIAFAKLMKD
jgi:hypothetical protein